MYKPSLNPAPNPALSVAVNMSKEAAIKQFQEYVRSVLFYDPALQKSLREAMNAALYNDAQFRTGPIGIFG